MRRRAQMVGRIQGAIVDRREVETTYVSLLRELEISIYRYNLILTQTMDIVEDEGSPLIRCRLLSIVHALEVAKILANKHRQSLN